MQPTKYSSVLYFNSGYFANFLNPPLWLLLIYRFLPVQMHAGSSTVLVWPLYIELQEVVWLKYNCMLHCVACALAVFVCTLIRVCVCVCAGVCAPCSQISVTAPPLWEESVEQDPDPPAGTNETHSSGLNGQLTIREPLWPCLLVRHS